MRACTILVLSLLLGGCDHGRHFVAMTRSTATFTACTPDPRILCEPNAEKLAAQIAPLVPPALAIIESKHFAHFAGPVRIQVYASPESFSRYSGASTGAAGMVTRGAVHISPAILAHPDGPAEIVAHELSHLNRALQLGPWRMVRLPGWFSEGLATWASGGGGPAYEPNIRHAIRNARHFEPIDLQPWWRPFQQPPERMSWPVYYNQTRMFVRFMHDRDPAAFRKMLDALGRRDTFADAVGTWYGQPLADLWQAFLASLAS
ncbi:hypothetical protein [uncultured Massilia sp.]|uniref:hypothetical protein n=1 Tax=uncultured Massilia sp. TaxID=169973 RepID=UPI002582A7E8|nr:hypothetical protein [uncultured Massilia sp.]